MSAGRIRHLLSFEWRRVKWLVVACWVMVIITGVPEILSGMGMAIDYHLLKGLNGVGQGGLLLAGVLLVMLTSLTGRGWRDVRPLRRGEVVIVQLMLLAAALIVPVLGVTLVNLTLLGFSLEVVVHGVAAVAAAVVPVWLGWSLFAAYAGRIPVVLGGMAALGFLEFGADVFQAESLLLPWIDVFGSATTPARWVATGVAVMILVLVRPLSRSRGDRLRMAVAVCALVAGWGAGKAFEVHRHHWLFPSSKATAVDVQGILSGGRNQPNVLSFVGSVPDAPDPPGEVLIWKGVGGGRILGRDQIVARDGSRHGSWWHRSTFDRSLLYWLDGPVRNRALMRVLDPECTIYLGNGASGQVVGHATTGSSQNNLWMQFEMVDGVARETPPMTYQGVLTNSSLRYRKVADLAPGESGIFREGVAVLRLGITGKWNLRRGTTPYTVSITLPTSSEEVRENPGHSPPVHSPLTNWRFVFHYPESDVYIVASENYSSGRRSIGGTGRWGARLELKIGSRRLSEALEGHTPRLLVFRPVVRRIGLCEADSGPLEFRNYLGTHATRTSYTRLIRADRDFAKFCQGRDLRPDPRTAGAEDLGAWLREIQGWFSYRGAVSDIAEFAGSHGSLLLRASEGGNVRHSLGRAYDAGAPEEDREELITQVGALSWAPNVVLSRGWGEEAREQVEDAIASGEASDDMLRLGVYLGSAEAVDRILERVAEGTNLRVYEVIRQVPGIEARLDEAIAASLQSLMESAEDSMAREQASSLRLDQWHVPLAHGNQQALADLISVVKKASARGFQVHSVEEARILVLPEQRFSYRHLIDMTVDDFRWDAVRRKWIHQEMEDMK